MNCIICQNELITPQYGIKRTSFSCKCGGQYIYYFKKKEIQLGGVQLRFSGWNMFYNIGKNTTRYVEIEKNRIGSRKEYNLDGLVLPERFLSLKAFL